jgi:hypothetical protein
MAATNDDLGAIVGANNLIRYGLGADLTPSSGVITVTDSLHFLTGAGAITTINVSGGNPTTPVHVTFIRRAASTVTFSAGGNLGGDIPTLADEIPIIAEWDGTEWYLYTSASTTSFGSQTTRTALIAPYAANGTPTFRRIKTGDLVDTAWFNVKDYGAVGNGTTNDAAAIQLAIDAAYAAGGGEVWFPPATYKVTSTLTMKVNVILKGAGRQSSKILVDHDGDGIKIASTINGSTAVNTVVRDLNIYTTRGTNTGGGYVDVAGSFVSLENVYISGFEHQVIFDQTEIGSIIRCELIPLTANGVSGVWLVNGDDHTALANTGFTNRIVIDGCQFNTNSTTAYNIVDDGGGAHVITNNNFNAGAGALRAAGVSGLTFTGNESEGHSTTGVLLTDTTLATDYILPCTSVNIDGNAFADITPYHIQANAVLGGSIQNNWFAQQTTAAVLIGGDPAVQLSIGQNSKLVNGSFKTAAQFLAGTSVRMATNTVTQRNHTYATSGAIAAGARTITPATMGYTGTTERIIVGSVLLCMNPTGTNAERVTVTGVAATTFDATFASAKDANFLIFGAS